MEEHGVDDDEAYDAVVEEMKNDAINLIMSQIRTDSRGLIYIERCICVPEFNGFGDINGAYADSYEGRLGHYWSYVRGEAIDASVGEGNQQVVFRGYVRPEDVDWVQTINQNMTWPDECEIYLGKGTPIEVSSIQAIVNNKFGTNNYKIDTQTREHVIWCGPAIMKA